jgi:hypothetical protein
MLLLDDFEPKVQKSSTLETDAGIKAISEAKQTEQKGLTYNES